jgi:hypothetical protein
VILESGVEDLFDQVDLLRIPLGQSVPDRVEPEERTALGNGLVRFGTRVVGDVRQMPDGVLRVGANRLGMSGFSSAHFLQPTRRVRENRQGSPC